MGGASVLMIGQQGLSLVDQEFDKLDPNLAAAAHAIQGQVSQGFTLTQVALATLVLPIIYQGVKILMGYAGVHQDTLKDRRDRERARFDSELRLKEERERKQMELDAEAARLRLRVGGEPQLPPPTV